MVNRSFHWVFAPKPVRFTEPNITTFLAVPMSVKRKNFECRLPVVPRHERWQTWRKLPLPTLLPSTRCIRVVW